MKKFRRGRNEPPRMTQRIPEAPIFDYMDMMRRHSYGHKLMTSNTLRERMSLSDSALPSLEGIVGGEVCWSGWCPGCGRALISATTKAHVRSDAFYCSEACKP